ncbi:MAG: hypothetical protein D6701_10055 [Gemmatimonadetes bacterium]|nr:MAG: hypothetical protein D6701_10055 [Gemmatimonadota bacterium]
MKDDRAFWCWIGCALVGGALVFTDLFVGGGGGDLVVDWRIGPGFVALLGGVWGAARHRRRLHAADRRDDHLAELEERELLRAIEVERDGARLPPEQEARVRPGVSRQSES